MVFCYLDDVVTACTFTIVFSRKLHFFCNCQSASFFCPLHCEGQSSLFSCKVPPFYLAVLSLTLLLLFSICAIPVTYLLNYRTHSKDITSVMFHRKYPLFASSSEDCTAYVCHGMFYSDLNQNPLIVPLEILRGHSSSDGRGMHGIGSLIFTLLI